MMTAGKVVGALVALATIGTPIAVLSWSQAGYAQTNGMDRRGDRRGTRQDSREAKHACNSAQGQTRADCRQTKRNVKQEGRQNRVSK